MLDGSLVEIAFSEYVWYSFSIPGKFLSPGLRKTEDLKKISHLSLTGESRVTN